MSKKKTSDRPYRYKGKSYKRPPISKVIDNVLTTWDYELDKKIQSFNISKSGNWSYWQNFLEAEKSFRYERAGVSMTVIKEKRRGSKKYPLRGGHQIMVWYGHRRIGGKLRRKYLGYSENLTTEMLYSAAFELAITKKNG